MQTRERLILDTDQLGVWLRYTLKKTRERLILDIDQLGVWLHHAD